MMECIDVCIYRWMGVCVYPVHHAPIRLFMRRSVHPVNYEKNSLII